MFSVQTSGMESFPNYFGGPVLIRALLASPRGGSLAYAVEQPVAFCTTGCFYRLVCSNHIL